MLLMDEAYNISGYKEIVNHIVKTAWFTEGNVYFNGQLL